MKSKLVDNFYYITDSLRKLDSVSFGRLLDLEANFSATREESETNGGRPTRQAHGIKKYVAAALGNDAFLVNIPYTFLGAKNIRVKGILTDEMFELHRVQECLNSYAFAYRLLRNNFVFETLNDKITQFLETGRMQKDLEVTRSYISHIMSETQPDASTEDFPRPFAMNDVSFAFISLVVGLVLSCLVFIAELIVGSNEKHKSIILKSVELMKNLKRRFCSQ